MGRNISILRWIFISILVSTSFWAGMWYTNRHQPLNPTQKNSIQVAHLPPPSKDSTGVLQSEIGQKNKTIDGLRQMIVKLAKRKETVELLNSDPVVIRERIEQIVDRLGEGELTSLISSFTHFSGDEIPKYGTAKSLAKSLINIASDGIISPSSKTVVENPSASKALPQQLKFFSEMPKYIASAFPKQIFYTDQKRIFAILDASQYPFYKAVLVKWMKVSPARILLFDVFQANKNSNLIYSYYRVPDGWPVGQYKGFIR